MSCFAVKFVLCGSQVIHYIDKIEAYDMGEATTLFYKIMVNKLNLNRSEFYIKDILEMKNFVE